VAGSSGALRWDPGRAAVASVVGVAAAVLLVGLWWLRHDQPAVVSDASAVASMAQSSAPESRTRPAPPSAQARVASVRPAAATPGVSSSAAVVVDVVGRVHRPGVYRLAPGSRVDDALRAAGGVLGGFDLATLNLARKVSDGEQIAVGVDGAAALPPSTSEAGSGDASTS